LKSVGDQAVLQVGHGVTAPRPINNPDPEYSEEARRAGRQGKCILSLVVNSEGRPEDIRVTRSLGMGLDEKAVEALRNWTFEPARKDGKPVAVSLNVVMTFHIGKGLRKMPPNMRKAIEEGQKAAAKYAWEHVYRVKADTRDSVCRPKHEEDEGSLATISGLTSEMQGYRLESITFTGNKTIYSFALRSIFSIKDGEIFDQQKVAEGFQKMKKVYGSQGFVSFAASVEPEIDDLRHSIALRIKCEEGRQFYVDHINIAGLDENTFERLRGTLYVKPGQLYNERLAYFWLEKNSQLLPADNSIDERVKMNVNENEGTVVMTYDFTRCSD
jgi:TonB family protein